MKFEIHILENRIKCGCDFEKYAQLGFVLDVDKTICMEDDVYPVIKEFFTLEALMQYIAKTGCECIIHDNTITIYNEWKFLK